MPIFGSGPPALPQQRRRVVLPASSAGVPAGSLTGSGDMAGASAGPGVAALGGSGAIAGAGAPLVAGAGAFSGAGTITGVSSGTFPLSAHASGRYLVRADGTPFLLCADTTWSLFVDIPLTEVSSYFSTLVSQGFNAVMGNALEHHYTTVKPPKERGGLLPFTQRMDGAAYTGSPNGTAGAAGTQGQFANDNYANPSTQSPDCTFINNAYWLVVEQILDAALANNLAVLVWPGYLGFHANDEGWMTEMMAWDAVTGAGGFAGQSFANPTKSKMWNYGAWMAARWKNYPHIIWVMGGDYGSGGNPMTAPQAAAANNLMAGLKSVAGQNSLLFTAHWDRPAISTDTSLAAGLFDVIGCYADESVAELARRGYAITPAKPTIGLEYYYDGSLFGGSAPFRKYPYWQFLGGVAGGFYGQEQLWRFDDGTPGTDWTTLLATQARLDAVRQFALWRILPWHRLKPSGLGGMTSLITAGGGTASPQSTDYVAAAATLEGDLLLTYIPPAHTGSITVAMTAMAATARARWFDPTNSTFTAIGMIANTGTHTFTPPGSNSAGDADFLLVLDTPVGALTGAGDMAGTSAVLASAGGAPTGTGAISGAGQALAATTAAMSGAVTLAGSGAAAAQGSATMAGSAALAGAGSALASGIGAVIGFGTLAGVGSALVAGASGLVGAGALDGIATAIGSGTAALAGLGDISASGSSPAPVVGAFTGSGTLVGAGAAPSLGAGTGALGGSGTLVGHGAALAAGAGAMTGTSAIDAAGVWLAGAAGSLSGAGTLAGVGPIPAAALSGGGEIVGVGTAVSSGLGSLSGSGSISAIAVPTRPASTRLTGVLVGQGQLTGQLQLQGVTMTDLIGPISIYQGDTAEFLLTVTDDFGQPFNLGTVDAVVMQVKISTGASDPPLIAKSLGNGIELLDQGSTTTRGQATIALTSADTDLQPGRYAMDVVVTAPGLRQHVIPPREFLILAVVDAP